MKMWRATMGYTPKLGQFEVVKETAKTVIFVDRVWLSRIEVLENKESGHLFGDKVKWFHLLSDAKTWLDNQILDKIEQNKNQNQRLNSIRHQILKVKE